MKYYVWQDTHIHTKVNMHESTSKSHWPQRFLQTSIILQFWYTFFTFHLSKYLNSSVQHSPCTGVTVAFVVRSQALLYLKEKIIFLICSVEIKFYFLIYYYYYFSPWPNVIWFLFLIFILANIGDVIMIRLNRMRYLKRGG